MVRRAALLMSLLMLVWASACSSSHGGTDSGVDAAADSAVDSGSDAAVDSGSDAAVDSGSDGGTTPWASCTANSECVVMPVTCCGTCGQASASDMVGVNRSHISEYRGDRCDVAICPACAGEPDPNLIATCEAGTCRALDVRTDPVSACTVSSDCTLRINTCCMCSFDPPIAIRADGEADFQALVCDGDEVCPECAPAFPNWAAYCQVNHCAAGITPGTGG